MSFGGSAIAGGCRSGICLANQTNTGIPPDDRRDIVA